jgi:hypothetical protein
MIGVGVEGVGVFSLLMGGLWISCVVFGKWFY